MSAAADPRAALAVARERAAAAEPAKRVAVVFGADWCPDCHALERALTHPALQVFVEPVFEWVKVDVGRRDRHLDFAAECGIERLRGIPAMAVLDAEGEVRATAADGELSSARAMSLVAITEVFRRLAAA